MRKPSAAANLTLGLSRSEGVVALLQAACRLISFHLPASYSLTTSIVALSVLFFNWMYQIALQRETMLRCVKASSSADSQNTESLIDCST
jgi:hypothetical protein